MAAVAITRPGYYEDVERARESLDEAVPIEEIVPDWAERATAIRARRTP